MKYALRTFLLAGTLATSLSAIAVPYTTSRFDALYKIESNGELQVTETIGVNFTQPQHGLRRWLPLHGQGRPGNQRPVNYELVGANLVAHGNTSPVSTQVTSDGDKWKLQVGNASTTLTGPATFEITYRVAGAITFFPAQGATPASAELYWNALPTYWPTSIDRASVTFECTQPFIRARVLTGKTKLARVLRSPRARQWAELTWSKSRSKAPLR